MDTLYIGDIPLSYHYAIFNNGYIDLYDREFLSNGTYTFYRIYTNCNGFYYKISSQNYSQYNSTTTQDIEVSNNIVYRNDFDSICCITFIIAIFGIWLFNLITSCVRKGGLLGGLL